MGTVRGTGSTHEFTVCTVLVRFRSLYVSDLLVRVLYCKCDRSPAAGLEWGPGGTYSSGLCRRPGYYCRKTRFLLL